MFYYVYILYSVQFNKLYIGFTKNLIYRIKQHNEGQAASTKPFIPYKLIHYEAYIHKLDAWHREQYLKSGYGRRSIKKMLQFFFNSKKNTA